METTRLAELCGEALFSEDHASEMLGIKIVSIKPGQATTSMVVRPDMVNGFDICHGGLVFSLADSAFALACNSRNEVSYAMGCQIEFLQPALKGDLLTAQVTEVARTRTTGSYSVLVTNQDNKTIAVFQGRSSSRGKPIITQPDMNQLEQDDE